MSDTLLHTTKGLVLRSVIYGETSLIVTVFTEKFGTQSYIVNGIRSSSKKGNNKASYFQPGSFLELVAYHNEFKNLQRIKEYRWSTLYKEIFFDVLKHCVLLYTIELLQKVLRQPDPHPELFYFLEDICLHLDTASPSVVANYPLFFSIHLPYFFGFRISDDFSPSKSILDLKEGEFVAEPPPHSYYLSEPFSQYFSELLKVQQPEELSEILLSQEIRRILLKSLQDFYSLHIAEFGTMRSLTVLAEVLS